MTVVACSTRFDNHKKIVVVTATFAILHLTNSSPLVSPVIHRWC